MIHFSYISSSPINTPHYMHLKPLKSNSTSNKKLKEYIKQKQSLTPGLLVTSHQIYREALPILYGSNKFVMNADEVLPAMITQFGNYGNHLRSLHLTRFWEASGVGKYMEPLVHLQSLTVDCSSDLFDQAQDIALIAGIFFDKTYRWIRGVASAHEDETYAANLVVINCNRDCTFECKIGFWQNWRRCVMADAFQCELKKIILARSSVSLPLLKLPRKVRDLVYQYAMVYTPPATVQLNDGVINIEIDKERGPLRKILDWGDDEFREVNVYDGFLWSESLTPGLLRVNRQIYQESVQILYGKNRFELEGSESAKEWLDRIGYSHVYLRDVNICYLPDDRTIFYKLLHVDRLSFYDFSSPDFDGSMSGSPEEKAEMFFALAGHWIEGVGSFRGGRAAAIDRIHPSAPVSEDEEEQWVSRFRVELKKICG